MSLTVTQVLEKRAYESIQSLVREHERMLKECRDHPRAEDEDRIAELEVNLQECKSVIANAILAYGEGATDSDIVRILKEEVTLEEARDAWNSLA